MELTIWNALEPLMHPILAIRTHLELCKFTLLIRWLSQQKGRCSQKREEGIGKGWPYLYSFLKSPNRSRLFLNLQNNFINLCFLKKRKKEVKTLNYPTYTKKKILLDLLFKTSQN